MLDAQAPPELLVARIARLEAALQLEAMERDELETKLATSVRLIAGLLEKVDALEQRAGKF